METSLRSYMEIMEAECSIENFGILYMETPSRLYMKIMTRNAKYGNFETLYMESVTWRSIYGNNDVAITWHLLGVHMTW